MMHVYRAVIIQIAVLLLATGETVAQAKLSRGHEILLRHGLQIQAQVFWQPTGSLNLKRWDDSGFTTINWQWSPNATLAGGQPWGRWATSGQDFRNLNRPTMVSFQLFDEQDLNDASIRAAAAKWFASARPLHQHTLLFTNQASDRVSTESLTAYLRESKPDMLMFDLYPFELRRGGGTRPEDNRPADLYRIMARYRTRAMLGHDGNSSQPIPYGMYLQTFTWEGKNWRPPSESEMRLNQFAAWTFGYTFVSAFTYNRDKVNSPLRPVLFDGLGDSTPNARFALMATINHESRRLGPALVRLLNTEIMMAPGKTARRLGLPNKVPEGVRGLEIKRLAYVRSLDAFNFGQKNHGLPGDVLVGVFRPLHESFDGPNHSGEMYFMLTNGLVDSQSSAYETRQRLRVDFDFRGTSIRRLLRLSRETGNVESVPLSHLGGSQYRLIVDLPGGTGDLFKFDTGAPFVGFR